MPLVIPALHAGPYVLHPNGDVPARPRMAVAMYLESFVARDAYFVGAVQMALEEAAAV